MSQQTNVQLFTQLYYTNGLTTLNQYYNWPNELCCHFKKNNLINLINLLKNYKLNNNLIYINNKLTKNEIIKILINKYNFNNFTNCEKDYINKKTFLIILNNLNLIYNN